MRLDHCDPSALVARREQLRARLGELSALLFAGAERPRNYRAATYPFRASSHFLYFAGVPFPNAVLRLDADGSTLFLPPREPDDALWHGPSPSLDQIADAVGCEVREADVPPSGDATLAGVDAETRERQRLALGRPVVHATEADQQLADAVIDLRLRHDAAALRELRVAADATRAAHLAGMAATRPDLLETEVRAAMEGELLRRGMGTAYGSIVTVHGEVLHNTSYHHRLEPDDLLLADLGAETPGGWAGDVTRTWPVSGRFSDTQRTIYELVLRAQEAAIASVAPGVRYRDVHLTAARALTVGLVDLGILRGDVDELVADGVHALLFPHGVGHLIGLDVHDMEDLGDRAGYAAGRERSSQFGLGYLRLDRDLEAGMAVTIEPGFYRIPAILQSPELRAIAGDRLDEAALDRFADVRGIRIEDDVLVTESGCEVLTADIPKSPAAVEAAVG